MAPTRQGALRRWTIIAAALITVTLPVYRLGKLMGFTVPEWVTLLQVAGFWVTTLLHGAATLGAREAVRFLFTAFGISLGGELLGTKTGWFFGSYSYHASSWTVGGTVPLLVPMIWALVGYAALYFSVGFLSAAGAASTGAPLESTWKGKVLATVVGAGFLTAWDLVADPVAVAMGGWQWHIGGAYFGIPVTNFRDWFITGLVIFGLFWIFKKPEQGETVNWTSLYDMLPLLCGGAGIAVNLAGCAQNGLWGPFFVGVMAFFPFALILIPNWFPSGGKGKPFYRF